MWKITVDKIAEPDEESRVGYHEEHTRIPVSMAIALGVQSRPLPAEYERTDHEDRSGELPWIMFRLRDEDDTLHYAGYLHDDDECLNQGAALMWGANDTGACIIEVRRDGKWVQEIG